MLVNRGDQNKTANITLLNDEALTHSFYDFITGAIVEPVGNYIQLDIEAHGMGTLIAVQSTSHELFTVLSEMKAAYDGNSLQYYSNDWQHLNQT